MTWKSLDTAEIIAHIASRANGSLSNTGDTDRPRRSPGHVIMSHAAHRGHVAAGQNLLSCDYLTRCCAFGHAQVEWDCATKGYAMNDLLIIDMLPTYGLLFYLLISVFVFVGMPWSAPEDLGSWPAAFCRRRVLGCFRARRRVRCAGVYHGSAFGAAGYGRLLPHVPARSSDLPAGIVHHTICLRRRCRVSGKVTWYILR